MKKIAFLILVSMMLLFVLAACTPTDGNDQNVDNNQTLGHEHVFGNELSYNSTTHYYACSCGEKKDVAEHKCSNIYDGKCDECGYQVSKPLPLYTVTIVTSEEVTATRDVVEVYKGGNLSFVASVDEKYDLVVSGAKVLGAPSVKEGVKYYALMLMNVTSDVTVNLSATLAPCSHSWSEVTCTEDSVCTLCGAAGQLSTGHDWQDATCTEPMTCSSCGVTFGSSNGHKGGTATCTELAVCSICGEAYGELKTHEWSNVSCTEDRYCLVCGEHGDEATGHNWTDATCTAPKTCSNCGETDGIALGHTMVDPTCTIPGYCSTCFAAGDAATGHSWTDADCTTPKTCSNCDLTQGNALGHTWTDATCTTPKTCGSCGETSGDPAGHTYTAAVTAPTCTEGGYTTYTCACGDTYDDNYTNPKGHSGPDATCEEASVCAACGTHLADALGHSYTTTVKNVTCTTNGYTIHTCANCSHTYTSDFVAAKGHSYESVVTSATCTDDGFTTYTCHCGDSYIGAETSATGHSYVTTVVASTCTVDGYTLHECHCGDSYVTDTVVAEGHTWVDATFETPKTCTTCGATEGLSLAYEMTLGENTYTIEANKSITVKLVVEEAGTYKITATGNYAHLVLFEGASIDGTYYEFTVEETPKELYFTIGNANRNEGYSNEFQLVVEKRVEVDVPEDAILCFIGDGIGMAEIEVGAGAYQFDTNIEGAMIIIINPENEEEMYPIMSGDTVDLHEGYWGVFVAVYDDMGEIVPLADDSVCWITCTAI